MRVRRTILCLFALAVLLPSTAFARTRFACDVDLIVRDSCCCPPKKHEAPQHVPTMQRECCKLVKYAGATSPAATAASTTTLGPIAIGVETATLIPPVRDARVAIAPRAQAPPPERSLLAQHCALLV